MSKLGCLSVYTDVHVLQVIKQFLVRKMAHVLPFFILYFSNNIHR